MKLRCLLAICGVLFLSNLQAQTNQEDILFIVDNDPVYVSEFLRVYNKNLDLVQDESQKDVDEYLTLFTNYKLKLKEARALGLHKKPSYIRELRNYKKQLMQGYITDAKVTDALIQEAYDRISYDVKASHILVKVSENANPKDTLAAYNTAINLRNRALKEGFEKVREEVHNGQTVFGESLGYFSGFKMVYKFENVAYNTKVGDISQVFRTRFGYHFLKVFDKRKSRGQVTVAHIMIANKQMDTVNMTPETRVKEIYKKLEQGEDFESLAKQFSDDKSTASRGGMLEPFSGGQLTSQIFEDEAFGLVNIGDVSQPFKTEFGWHIVKLYDRKPIRPFEALKPELEVRVKRDDRSRLIDEALIENLKKRYNINSQQPDLSYFVSILNEDYFKRTWVLPSDFTANKPLVKIVDEQLTYKDFADYLLKAQRQMEPRAPFPSIVSKKYNAFFNSQLIKYREDHLEEENEEYAHVVNEYRDGLLLFDLMESTIWNISESDSLDLQNFYNSHKAKYMLPKCVDAIVATSTNQKALKKVAKLLHKGLPVEQIKNLVNSNNTIQVIFTSGVMDASHQALPKDFVFKKGMSKVYYHHDAFVVVQVNKVLPEAQKAFEDAKGSVISDYQIYKESNWIKELREKFKVTVNQEALKKVKLQIKSQ
ncbi:peptidylprolyl isomerase [Snuella sedimenti]|uniref:Peptidylprolyl isomerase n=1 Tax=Snuella sedimenti TaxID=2798802 RepID=A0A8J7LTG2_9FLAO|nr:peptidylprolyl isomerase [Snuella sedimenti]MBJ6368331.1 peptidylprolyl isomerase [Snuella sedimenti]